MSSSNFKKLFVKTFIACAAWTSVANLAEANSGNLKVTGQAGKYQLFQKVKAVRCSLEKRGQCDPAVFFDLNQSAQVPVGHYILGFENSLYPDLVEVRSGRQTEIQLEKVYIPAQVRGEKIRIYRDFSSLAEQKKIYLSMYFMNRHFFRLEKENFGDLYLTGVWERDFVQRFTYEVCPVLSALGTKEAKALSTCAAWNGAKNPMDLKDLFQFGSDGTFTEMWVSYPGDVFASKHPRYLVSAPVTDQDFVSVFPGQYKVQAEGKGQPAVSIRAGRNVNVSNWENLLNASSSKLNLMTECFQAKIWKTDERAHCTSDSQEGCHRMNAKSCELM